MSNNPHVESFLALWQDPEGITMFANAVNAVVNNLTLGHKNSHNIDKLEYLAACIASSQYAIQHMAGVPRFATGHDLLASAARQAPATGLIIEFGVFLGGSIAVLASQLPGRKLYGFDSFEGLPETWRPGFEKGAFRCNAIPPVPASVELIIGWFDRTLPHFLDAHPDEAAALIHIDCDLYASTQTVLQQMKSRIRPGTIIVFDEYFNYPGWEQHEFRAFQEWVAANRIHYEYIGLVPEHQQVAVRIIR